ncbi:VOC family protein [Rhodococcus sp. NPDC058505]|uniref:VOC family protein n=1 Tax=unclassified Rhodococcus (in: high G+C Gram-positive bacteria) TaxID=192944 RepID=UPI00364DF80F
MSVTSVYPVLMTRDVESTARFYREHFGFLPAFEADWYVSLIRDGHELAVLDADHETVPAALRGTCTSGLILNIEVDDVDDVHRRLVTNGDLEAVLPLRSEAFGQRHFIVAGPGGVLIDVITPIAPDASFAAGFTDAATDAATDALS